MNSRIPIEFVGSPAHLPKVNTERVAVLDVAFASGKRYYSVTEPFINRLASRLVLWCDHHEHLVGWSHFGNDPRFILVPNRQAHACPELITPEIAQRVSSNINLLILHGDFDGILTGAKLLRGGVSPYPEADEDARCIDSPGRGHQLSPRGEQLALAVDEAVATFSAGERRRFLTAVVWSLVEENEPASLREQIQAAAQLALSSQKLSTELAREHGRGELPGLYVIRLQGRRQGRQRKSMLRFAEEQASIGVILEKEGETTWVTAATFDEEIDLSQVVFLDGGRSDYRYGEFKGPIDSILQALARVADL